MRYEYLIIAMIAVCFLVVGHIESHEPTPHYAQVDCPECHLPNLNTYQAYAEAWPSPKEARK